MKKIIVAFLMLFTTSSLINAQAFEGPGDQKLQMGLNAYGYGSGLMGSFDYGISDLISVGAGADIYFDDDDDDNGFFAYGRGNFHLGQVLNMPSIMDLYPGISLGVVGDDFGIGGHLGFRYFFTNNIGAFVEIGSRGGIGVSINL